MPLHVLVGSLGIPLMGRSMCKRIVDAGYDTVEALQQATVEELEAIHELGRSKAEAFREGFDLRYPLIQKLLANGVTLQAPASGPMLGLSVCLTGFRDPAMVTAIEAQGGVVKSGVSKALSLLVCKDPSSTSGKVKKAKSYGVEILSIEAMWERLGGRP